MSDIVDRIDEQLAQGEPYVEQGPQLCPKCGDDWHALPVTERLRMMRHAEVIDPDYRYSTDTSPVVCEGVPADEAIPRPQVPAPDFGSLYRVVEQLPEMQGRRGGLQWPGALAEVQAGVLIIPAELEAPRPPFSMLLEMALIDAKNEPVDAPVERRAWPIIALLAAVFILASGALPVPDWAKAVVRIATLLVLTAATMRGVYLTLRWADKKPQAIEPPRSTEPASAEPEREPAFVLDSGTFTPVSDCPACQERAVHALDVAHTGDGIGRVCECGHRWSQTGL